MRPSIAEDYYAEYPPTDPDTAFHSISAAQKTQFLSDNRTAFAKLEEGLKYPYFAVQPRSVSFTFPFFAKDREMARALVFGGRVKAERGDLTGAMRYYLDAMNIGSDLPHGAGLLGALVGAMCEATGRRRIESTIDQLNVLQCQTAISQLDKMDSDRQPAFETLVEQKWSEQADILELKKPRAWHEFAKSYGGDLLSTIVFKFESPQTACHIFTSYMNKLIAHSKEPWPEQNSTPPPAVPNDAYCMIFAPVDPATFRIYEASSLDRLLILQIRLHEYRLQHGMCPTLLNKLVASCIHQKPSDPFTNGSPLIYKIVGKSYLLYSVGPDSVDNGGTPIVTSATTPFGRHLVRDAAQKGDIVAGVNH
jgi:hypothetical protein